jgi:hypothetical protein
MMLSGRISIPASASPEDDAGVHVEPTCKYVLNTLGGQQAERARRANPTIAAHVE